MDLFRVFLLSASALPLALFIFRYVTEPVPGKRHLRRLSKVWLETPLGPAWLAQKIALLSIILSILAFFLFGDYPFRRELTDLLYTLLIGLFWAHLVLLWKVQNQRRRLEWKKRQQANEEEDKKEQS
jgi:type VI protein secretion system component VasK